MKLLERSSERLVFGLTARDKDLLDRLLILYPLQTDPGVCLSRREGESLRDATNLLKDALQDRRVELTQWIKQRFLQGEALSKTDGGWKLTLEAIDSDRLLQVLNELRVGSWAKLGSPDELSEASLATTPGLAPLYLIMALAGQFEMALVHALLGDSDENAAQ